MVQDHRQPRGQYPLHGQLGAVPLEPAFVHPAVRAKLDPRAAATGLHLYPRKAWRWPYGCDRAPSPSCNGAAIGCGSKPGPVTPGIRPRSGRPSTYWTAQLAERTGRRRAALAESLRRFGADVLPGIQRLVWLGIDNHTLVAAGITLAQLQKVKGVPFLPVPGMVRIPRYLESLRRGAKVAGETPIEFLAAREREAERALAEARMAARAATSHQAEAQRIMTDAEAVLLVARFYHQKMQAAAARASGDAGRARTLMQASLQDFRDLTRLTTKTYDSISDVPHGTARPVQARHLSLPLDRRAAVLREGVRSTAVTAAAARPMETNTPITAVHAGTAVRVQRKNKLPFDLPRGDSLIL